MVRYLYVPRMAQRIEVEIPSERIAIHVYVPKKDVSNVNKKHVPSKNVTQQINNLSVPRNNIVLLRQAYVENKQADVWLDPSNAIRHISLCVDVMVRRMPMRVELLLPAFRFIHRVNALPLYRYVCIKIKRIKKDNLLLLRMVVTYVFVHRVTSSVRRKSVFKIPVSTMVKSTKMAKLLNPKKDVEIVSVNGGVRSV